MGVQLEDRTTIDMFTARAKGRPRSNPYPRDVQIRINKRLQRERDRNKGMRRMEVKIPSALVEQLDQFAKEQACTRTEAVELGLTAWFEMLEGSVAEGDE
ncbi:LexA regulated protein [Bermanella sp. R86510]|uniref:LexA regulated protein n=1 Tax=unclassified Bermanella TaxID=2627862 RepID=UPI0037C990BA